MFYVVELSRRAIVGDSRGALVWDVSKERSDDRANALQWNNPDMQFAVAHISSKWIDRLPVVSVEHRDPLKLRTC